MLDYPKRGRSCEEETETTDHAEERTMLENGPCYDAMEYGWTMNHCMDHAVDTKNVKEKRNWRNSSTMRSEL